MKRKLKIAGVALIVLVALALFNGCTGIAFTCEDQSRQKLNTCNIDCGEGILSEFCKSKCTQENKDRLDACSKPIWS